MASKLALMQARTGEYIALAATDPSAYPITIERIADFVPVARRLFYKTDPNTRALLAQIDEAKRLQRAAGPRTPTGMPGQTGGAETTDPAESRLREEQLRREIEQVVSDSTRVMQRYVAQRKRAPNADEAPLALFDLEETVAVLHKHISQLTPLVREDQRRRKAARLSAAGAAL